MNVGTLSEQLSETCRITDFEKKQGLVHILRYELFDTYVHEYGSEYDIQDDQSWMDDLDEAA
jgi:hypothetical protein